MEHGDVKASTGTVNHGKRVAPQDALFLQSKLNDKTENANYNYNYGMAYAA